MVKNNLFCDYSRYYGAVYFLEQISEKIGVIEDLSYCFPKVYKNILSLK
jgi:hypothetical protein